MSSVVNITQGNAHVDTTVDIRAAFSAPNDLAAGGVDWRRYSFPIDIPFPWQTTQAPNDTVQLIIKMSATQSVTPLVWGPQVDNNLSNFPGASRYTPTIN